jgi:hypothetical protein
MNKYIVLGCIGLIASMCHGSAGVGAVGPWENIEQMKQDISSYQTGGFTNQYFGTIRQRIEAIANVVMADRSPITQEKRYQIDNALCLLWVCKSRLSDIKIIQKVRSENVSSNPADDILGSLNNLIEIIRSGFDALIEIVKKGDHKDFTDLAIYTAFLHTNIKNITHIMDLIPLSQACSICTNTPKIQ